MNSKPSADSPPRINDCESGPATDELTRDLVGGGRQASQNKQQQQARKDWEQKEASNYSVKRNEYNRAYGACLEGRGYSVK